MAEVQYFTADDGCRIAYRFDGPEEAPVLLLSNSLGTTMEMWAPQMATFTQRFRVLRYDSRGHGQSDTPAGAYSMDRLGRDAVLLLDAVGVARADFCGLSKGGMVGQWLGVRAPERIGNLILANTSAYMGPPSGWQNRIEGVLRDGMTPLAEASIARWFTPAFPSREPEAVAPIREMLLGCDPSGYAGCCAAIRDMDLRPTASLIALPTLVIAGRQDPSTSVEDGRWLADAVRQGQLAVVDAAHLSNVEASSEFCAAVLGFL
ncbi:3-oxoadipate enol-lactonase [Brevundimonas naejangsanensis]|uniref:3-oxoadipate enol-lactonase n=1 Tax=Brevundimonas naejangsanensis TaxID=588932 RepID=A0A494RMR0_9CAUL|nr:3-oxoadipate enol-lactonase [Brevundimonas naejangsanensis]AYG94816.1 3-oxoadipate enol-lactonase [Brevundimonas naejangsanensis]